jgi:hypothetical protein
MNGFDKNLISNGRECGKAGRKKSVGGVKKEGGNLLRGMPADAKNSIRSFRILQANDCVHDSYIVADKLPANFAPLQIRSVRSFIQ